MQKPETTNSFAPNAKEYIDAKTKKSTETAETPEGRNIIRGQAGAFSTRFPHKEGEYNPNNPEEMIVSSAHIRDWVLISTNLELGLPIPKHLLAYDYRDNIPDNAKDATNELKRILDLFRKQNTEEKSGKIVLAAAEKTPSTNLSFLPSYPEGRNIIRVKAKKWLANNPIIEGKTSTEHDRLWNRINDFQILSTNGENGKLYWPKKEPWDPSKKRLWELPVDKEKKEVTDPAKIELSKRTFSSWLQQALLKGEASTNKKSAETKNKGSIDKPNS
jgi:hypothetical protein